MRRSKLALVFKYIAYYVYVYVHTMLGRIVSEWQDVTDIQLLGET